MTKRNKKIIRPSFSLISLTVIFTASVVMIIAMTMVTGVPGAAAAEVSQDRFDEANRLYEEGKYADALTIYREMETLGSHWKLFYNMGNCYYKSGLLVQAKIYYLKARRLEPFDSSIEKNIKIVNQRLNDKIPTPKPDFISRLVLRLESFISLNALSIVLLLLVVVFNVFLFQLIRKGKNRWIIYGISFSLVLAMFLGVYHIYRAGKHNRRNVAVITVEDARLRSGPGENNTVLFKVNPGLKVKIIDSSSSGQWLQVSASTDIAGWVEADSLQRI
ncbi:MAG: SH3 domain-containing protein [bacterium]|nr:SH3 domain-containing protein [bacterium]